ncbi:N-acetylmuramic acid 6-phosphate etherase [Wohlfahrtiimonas chitiniclastica]|uniref:N-acetylmuramic acid 6-phosphate etherase n=1 Tax=Wohlfahrtiimonas chitiniclastica TaxID=400946 RepID=UPI000B98F3E5|nr:N-acetylmuramic acid 6-phosphate etherase [Wohlfahrtiimonas chitiniclastica]OYQ80220.1 N-acetylmuramic acid 6-phosphate etherase [Wohlfahrtiimonas chitiniclastica]
MTLAIHRLTTEQHNPRTQHIDAMSTLEMVKTMNQEDQAVIDAIANASENISHAIDAIVAALKSGGRLIYIGAGTSGRLGVLDASECLPTFGVGEEKVMGIIAGGDRALRHPVENAEDRRELCVEDLKRLAFNDKDILCAIAASGRTPYCLGGLDYAKTIGAKSIAVTCTENNPMLSAADYPIAIVTGAEVITGSTRLKAGSAQKMVLNMLSTCSMIQLGKTYGNVMVDVKPTNEKLHQRALNMLMSILEIDEIAAHDLLERAHHHVKTALLMHLQKMSYAEAQSALAKEERLAVLLKEVK